MISAKGFSHPFDILQHPQHSAHALEVARTRLKLAWRVFGRGANLICREPVKQVIAPVENSHMWTKELVL
jgi:hypothetical protein